MDIQVGLDHLRQASAAEKISIADMKAAIENVLEWLNQPNNNTDENCRKISVFVATQMRGEDIRRFAPAIQEILFDMGAALHDTYSAPQVAENFDSTPAQLLTRVRKL